MQISLDARISSLADATFEMLRVQHWFDAILLIDDSASSDLFSYRLSHLCKNVKTKITNKGISLNGANNITKTEFNMTQTWKNLMIIHLSRALIQREVNIF